MTKLLKHKSNPIYTCIAEFPEGNIDEHHVNIIWNTPSTTWTNDVVFA